MNWRSLQHSPLVFWTLAFLAVAGPAWTYWNDQASRERSYFLDTKNLVDVEDFGSSEVFINGQRVTEGTIYINRLYIWNSGNTDLLSEDIGEPIQWSNVPAKIHWSELPIKVDIKHEGVGKDQLEGVLVPGPTDTGLRFKKMYAGSGIIATFLTKSEPDISLTGSVSGADNGSGLTKRKIYSIVDLGFYFFAIWLLSFMLFVKLLWRDDDYKTYFGKFWTAGMFACAPVAVGWFITDNFLNYGLPPF